MTAKTTHNFSIRDLSESTVSLTVPTAAVIRRQRGSRDLRHMDFRSLEDVSSRELSSENRPARSHSLTSSPRHCESSLRDSLYDSESVSPLDGPPVSFFDFSDDEDEAEDEDTNISPFSSYCWTTEDWPLKTDKRHKDSAIVIDPGEYSFSNMSSRRASSCALTSTSSVSNSRHSRATSVHDEHCLCRYCRQTRHKRRKSSLGLFEKLEDCRHVMMAIRDPKDPSNLERGIAYGHWLKLARLYVKYETLLDKPVGEVEQDEKQLLEYLTTYNKHVDLIKDEAQKWSHLFADRIDVCTVASCTGPPRLVSVRPQSITVHRRVQSWTLSMLDRQGPIGNCRAIGSNFF